MSDVTHIGEVNKSPKSNQAYNYSLSDSKRAELFQLLITSDGSGPKKSGSGRARALKVGLGPGPGLSPSLKAGLRAGPGLGPLPT